MIDPRSSVIPRRLADVGRIVGFCSAKGGVGKTLCTAMAGVGLAARGKRVGILDLDLQGASTHIALGAALRLPEEDKGILPLPVTENLCLVGAALFSGERALALRGAEVSDALLELLAVTVWGRLDWLLVDMPPGLGEEILDCARLLPRMEALVISTPSAISVSVVERLLDVLAQVRLPVAGVVANMARGDSASVRDLARRSGVAYAGEVPFDPGLESALGDPVRLAGTSAAAGIMTVMERLGRKR
jgi:ATP-binding protein involved in chromosome partitioning